MNEFEDFALGQFLSIWDESTTYQQNIDAMNHKGGECESCKLCMTYSEIGAWEPFENDSFSWLAEQIESMKESLMRSFIPKPKEEIK